jgi:hypothetical protein
VKFGEIYYIQALSPSGIAQSTVEMAADVWDNFHSDIEKAGERDVGNYLFEELYFVPDAGGMDAPERKCLDLASALEWARGLDPDED